MLTIDLSLDNNMRNIKKTLPILVLALAAINIIFNQSTATSDIETISLASQTNGSRQTSWRVKENNNFNEESDNYEVISINNTSLIETHTSSVMTDNPHLPEPAEVALIDTESSKDDLPQLYNTALEPGQSRTFSYSLAEENDINSDSEETNNDGYFLQPGQTREFSASPAAREYVFNENE